MNESNVDRESHKIQSQSNQNRRKKEFLQGTHGKGSQTLARVHCPPCGKLIMIGLARNPMWMSSHPHVARTSSDSYRKKDIPVPSKHYRLDLELGDLEAAVIGSIVRLGKASARQVAADLEPSRGLAYTTISTTLDRLFRKGLLAREEATGRGGSRYIYRVHSEDKVKGRVVKGFVDRLLVAFGPSVISTLHTYMDDIPKDQLKRLEDKIRRESSQRQS